MSDNTRQSRTRWSDTPTDENRPGDGDATVDLPPSRQTPAAEERPVESRRPQSDLSVLQISSSRMEFFEDQVRILDELGLDCESLSYPPEGKGSDGETRRKKVHKGILNRIYGHNALYYGIRAADFYPRILKKAWTGDYDLVHLNSGMVAPLGLAQPKRPIVLTLWGDDLLGNRLRGYQPAITKLCAKQCDRVIVRSEQMRQALPCDAEIIPSGIDMRKFRPVDRTEARNAVSWDPESRHVLFPYPKRREKKRYPVAKEVVETVAAQFDDPVELQVIENVPHEKMYLYYNAADALLLPSLREGSPNTVKEAMACNVPVVSTDVGDVRTRLGPVDNSHVCVSDEELVDGLRAVLERDGRSDGRTHVRDVSLHRMGQRLIDIYEDVLEERHS